MQWRAFVHKGTTYDLSHLSSKICTFVQSAQKDKPARSYRVEVDFGLHCFTRDIEEGETSDPILMYSDARETRIFDFERYELSKLLPDLVDSLPCRKCFHTEKGNFFTIEINGEERALYHVFFEASRTGAKETLRLFVQSAYLRDWLKRKPIGFFVVLFNVQNNREIKVPI